MGRLMRIEVNNFKSYAGTQHVGPFKDFTAVIGPNGAGKSNLMDAISFVLGVQSRHLRSTKISDLVFRADGNLTVARRASVKVVYVVAEGEVDGHEDGDEIHFSRVISGAGASSYRLDDKEVTWEAYEKQLRDIGVLVKARNFLVFQGDVESIASKSPKELTQLFEQISGADEYRAEYEALKKDKEKAEEDTIFNFQKKKGFQAERKQVKEQKEEAERFKQKLISLEELKTESYLVQLYHINKKVREHEDDIEAMKEEAEEAQQRERDAEAVLKSKKKESAVLKNRYQKLQAALEKRRRQREDLGPQRIKLKEEIKTLERQIADGEKTSEQIGLDRDAQRDNIAALSRDIAAVKSREEAAEMVRKKESERTRLSDDKEEEYERLKGVARGESSAQREEVAEVDRKLGSVRSRLDQLRSEQASLDKRLAGFEDSRTQYQQRQQDMQKTSRKAAIDKQQLQKELDELTGRSRGDAQKAVQIEEELRTINEELKDVRVDRRQNKHQEKMSECLEILKRDIPGVRGRLVDLCKPTQRKYNQAVTAAAGRHMEAIVVDTKEAAMECIRYMRDNRVGRANFIPLDTVKVKETSERLRSLGPRHRLCADIMQCEEGLRKAVLFAVGNTVVSDTLDDARQLCYGQNERVKAVTLNGAVISKSGNMTGGTTARDLDRAGQWDEKEFNELKRRREELEAERETLSRAYRNKALQTELATKIRGLASREQHSLADLEITMEKLRDFEKHAHDATVKREQVAQDMNVNEKEEADYEAQLRTLQERVDAVENQVFAPFLASVGATDIRAFEEGQLKDMQEHHKGRMKLQQHRAKLEAQLEHEKSRDFDAPLAKIARKAEARRRQLEELEEKREDLGNQEQILMHEEDEAQKEQQAAKASTKSKEAEVKSALVSKQNVSKERSSIGKRINSEESELEQARAKLHEVLQRARVEEVALPLLDGTSTADQGGRNRDGGEDSNGQNREGTADSEESDASNMAGSSMSSMGTGRPSTDASSQFSSEAHFSQTQSRTVQRDREDALNVDLSKLKRHRSSKEPHELEEILATYAQQMKNLQGEIDVMQPNMKAAERFGDVTDRLKASGHTFEQSKQNAAGATLKFNQVKQDRFDAFMHAFDHISASLNVIYKDLTLSSKHPLGGNAFLSLDDQEEPYLGGVKFNAMPPMKRFRDMEQLSGGEKTVAALALLFAIHSYRPAPFFVMDEIDAALDNINVRKVCNYIQQRSDDFQSIVISLKDMFYEKADALVGICRDQATNSSRTLTLDLQAIDNV